METTNLGSIELRSKIKKTVEMINGVVLPLTNSQMKSITPNELADKINKFTSLDVESIEVNYNPTFMYKVKIDDEHYIITDGGYILKSANITNIFGLNEELNINSFISAYANVLNIEYVSQDFLSETYNRNDQNHYNLFDTFFVVINSSAANEQNIDEIYSKLVKIVALFKEVATNNVNLPMNSHNIFKTIQEINDIHHNNVNYKSFNIYQSIQQVFNLTNGYKNNDFSIRLGFNSDILDIDDSIIDLINLDVQRVPNEVIKLNNEKELSSSNKEVVAIKDNGNVVKAISKKIGIESLKTTTELSKLIESSSKGKVKIKSVDHPLNTAIPRWNNMFNLVDSELVILGTDDEIVRMLSILERVICKILYYVDRKLHENNAREKINSILNSNISAYEINKNFGIAANKVTQLRNGKFNLNNLSFENSEKLEKAFNYYFNEGLIGIKGNGIKEKFVRSNFGLSDNQMQKVQSFIKTKKVNVVITGGTASGKTVLIKNLKEHLKVKKIVCFYNTDELAEKVNYTNGSLWLGEVIRVGSKNMDIKDYLYKYVMNRFEDKNKAIRLINDVGMEIHLNRKNDNGKTVRFIDYINVYDEDGKHDFNFGDFNF
ncbi:hypothetical protein DY052_07430 [Apilactobacillus timberlakei]|uniref:ATPase, T2SS/T4P/T4SS family n=1 Tax=Apilactobacillus timberlakei TaxID=2008380 RepID=UPI001129A479|nr:ATPase, T2SS/T4P/T4SS family [Apilactobacillus timberlakei]TPR13684.1 hypothetical protein DY052_07430 [Apilactobacillus timberlakei]